MAEEPIAAIHSDVGGNSDVSEADRLESPAVASHPLRLRKRCLVYSRFDWASNRIMRRRKAWLATTTALADLEGFKALYGNRWWFSIGDALLKVILLVRYYQVLRDRVYEWDDLGWLSYQEDLGRYADLDSDDARRRQSLFDFFSCEGVVFGYSAGQAAG